jgi:drug/metabolite transporter (DMT)-like permease
VWGLAFLLPVQLGGWNPVIVTIGRYLAYGLLSSFLLALGGRAVRQAARRHWRIALAFAIAGNVGYYLLLVVAIRAAGAPLTDMVIGAIPVVVAVVGNWLSPAYRWRQLALPLILVTSGLALVSALEISGVHAYKPGPADEKVAGLIAACAAVILWTWYALANARFLARHPAVSAARWSTVVGVATGAVTLAGLPLAAVTGQLTAPAAGNPGTGKLITAVVILGVVVSWAGTWLWNLASSRLSPTLGGLLVNVETVAGFAYVYAVRPQCPPAGQLTGLILVITGITITVRRDEPGDRTNSPSTHQLAAASTEVDSPCRS